MKALPPGLRHWIGVVRETRALLVAPIIFPFLGAVNTGSIIPRRIHNSPMNFIAALPAHQPRHLTQPPNGIIALLLELAASPRPLTSHTPTFPYREPRKSPGV